MSGSCPNASAVPAADLHRAVIDSLHKTFTPESFEKYLAEKAAATSEIESRRAELEHLTNVVIPGLTQREQRLVDAIENGTGLDVERGRLKAVTAECEAAEASRTELEAWARDAKKDRERAEEVRDRWTAWAPALEKDIELARQILGKALAGAPIYILPAPERRTWYYLGLASYEGLLQGAVRPGYAAPTSRTRRSRSHRSSARP